MLKLKLDDVPKEVLQAASVDVASTWRSLRLSMTDAETQTDPVVYEDLATQTATSSDAAIQTDSEPQKAFKLLEKYNRSSLTKFLAAVEPDISSQLMKNVRSTAFEGYTVRWTDEVDSVTQRFTLSHQDRVDPESVGCQVAWNRSGSVVAVAYGRTDHVDWCTHKGQLCAWNTVVKEFKPNTASVSIEVPNCLTTIAFHPELPSIIAGGTFNGVLVLWDINFTEDPVLMTSQADEWSHTEPVTKIQWVPAGRKGIHDILSVSGDGKVLLWSTGNGFASPVSGGQLLLNSIPRSVRSRTVRNANIPLGATSVSISLENKRVFVVVTEAGFVCKCSLDKLTAVPSKAVAPPAKKESVSTPKALGDPITFHFSPYPGPVLDVACAPFHRNLFLTCGSDGVARLYNLLQSKYLLLFEPSSESLYAADWSPIRPGVFAVASADGFVYIYDLTANQSIPVASVRPEGHGGNTKITGGSLTTLAFSPTQDLAASDATGAVHVWRLSSFLTEIRPGDIQAVNSLGDMAK